ncbi:hypothetical protein KCU89_g123, partial [Aureobasidium melanogenum]
MGDVALGYCTLEVCQCVRGDALKVTGTAKIHNNAADRIVIITFIVVLRMTDLRAFVQLTPSRFSDTRYVCRGQIVCDVIPRSTTESASGLVRCSRIFSKRRSKLCLRYRNTCLCPVALEKPFPLSKSLLYGSVRRQRMPSSYLVKHGLNGSFLGAFGNIDDEISATGLFTAEQAREPICCNQLSPETAYMILKDIQTTELVQTTGRRLWMIMDVIHIRSSAKRPKASRLEPSKSRSQPSLIPNDDKSSYLSRSYDGAHLSVANGCLIEVHICLSDFVSSPSENPSKIGCGNARQAYQTELTSDSEINLPILSDPEGQGMYYGVVV